ncbi:MAG: hypothetical protein JW778_07145 [Candidatus Altiarchaeota archaeon]|nr:hypothetical protein [Candidatus Altiarchaeota archaeon]
MYYEDVFRELNKRRVKYLVVGGVAIVLHGVVRLTVDLDLMVHLGRENLAKFIDVLGYLGYKPKAPVKASDLLNPEKRSEWRQKKNMMVFSFYNPKKPFEVVDVFIDEPIDFDKAYTERKVFKAKGIRIPVISLEGIKKLKEISGRTQDVADMKALNELEKIKNEKKN